MRVRVCTRVPIQSITLLFITLSTPASPIPYLTRAEELIGRLWVALYSLPPQIVVYLLRLPFIIYSGWYMRQERSVRREDGSRVRGDERPHRRLLWQFVTKLFWFTAFPLPSYPLVYSFSTLYIYIDEHILLPPPFPSSSTHAPSSTAATAYTRIRLNCSARGHDIERRCMPAKTGLT